MGLSKDDAVCKGIPKRAVWVQEKQQKGGNQKY